MSQTDHWLSQLSQEIWDIYRDYRSGKLFLSQNSIENAIELAHVMSEQRSPKRGDDHVPFALLDDRFRVVIIWYDKATKTSYHITCSDKIRNRYTWIKESKSSKVSELYVEDLDWVSVRYLNYLLERDCYTS